jgi:GDP-mannose 6-dehydrogenase
VVIRSTVPAGTTRNVVLPLLEAESGLLCGRDFGLCFQPEFLREGVAIEDFFDPPKTVIGGYDDRSADTLAGLYDQIGGPLIRTSLEAAEMVKQVDNAWHAVKVAFANEVGRLCQGLGTDSHEVMGIFVRDTKLNISPNYLSPGFAFGGSCLPKDVRSICAVASENGIEVPLMRSILPSNDAQIGHALELIEGVCANRIGVLGVTFKTGTDDLRESPQVDLIGRILSGSDRAEVRVWDPNVTEQGLALAASHSSAASPGTRSALRMLPSLLVAVAEDLVRWADLIVVGHGTAENADLLRRAGKGKVVLDLARLPPDLRAEHGYIGVCW